MWYWLGHPTTNSKPLPKLPKAMHTPCMYWHKTVSVLLPTPLRCTPKVLHPMSPCHRSCSTVWPSTSSSQRSTLVYTSRLCNNAIPSTCLQAPNTCQRWPLASMLRVRRWLSAIVAWRLRSLWQRRMAYLPTLIRSTSLYHVLAMPTSRWSTLMANLWLASPLITTTTSSTYQWAKPLCQMSMRSHKRLHRPLRTRSQVICSTPSTWLPRMARCTNISWPSPTTHPTQIPCWLSTRMVNSSRASVLTPSTTHTLCQWAPHSCQNSAGTRLTSGKSSRLIMRWRASKDVSPRSM